MSKLPDFRQPASFIVLTGSIILNLLLCILIFANLPGQQMPVYFNSDTLYVPSIYRDLFINHNGIAGWHLNGAPNIFPDMILYFVIRSFFSSFIPAMFTYSLLQVMILLILLMIVYKQFIGEADYTVFITGTLLMTLFLLVSLINKDFGYTFYMFSISYHMSAFLMALFCLIFLIRFLKYNRTSALLIMFFTAIVAIINDRLFMVIFSIPVLSLSVLILKDSLYRKRLIKVLAADVLSGGIALPLFTLLRFNSPIRIISLSWKVFSFDLIPASVKMFWGQHNDYLSKMGVSGIIDILFLLSLIIHSILLTRKLLSYFRNKDTDLPELIYLLLFVAITTITLVMPLINGSYSGWDMLRYNIYSLYLGVFSYGYLIYKFKQAIPAVHIQVFAVMASLFLAVTVYTAHEFQKTGVKSGLHNFLHYYPEKVACMDSLAWKYNLHNGIATYWEAKYTTMFSKKGLCVFTVYSNLNPWYHVMNENWYYFEDGSENKLRIFDFIITNQILPDTIIKYLGLPEDTLRCGADTEILKMKSFQYSRKQRRPFLLMPKDEKE